MKYAPLLFLQVTMFQSFYDTMIRNGRWMLIPRGLGTTLLIAACAVLIGSILGCIFALFKISQSKDEDLTKEELALKNDIQFVMFIILCNVSFVKVYNS